MKQEDSLRPLVCNVPKRLLQRRTALLSNCTTFVSPVKDAIQHKHEECEKILQNQIVSEQNEYKHVDRIAESNDKLEEAAGALVWLHNIVLQDTEEEALVHQYSDCLRDSLSIFELSHPKEKNQLIESTPHPKSGRYLSRKNERFNKSDEVSHGSYQDTRKTKNIKRRIQF